jgi:hypothetical protein
MPTPTDNQLNDLYREGVEAATKAFAEAHPQAMVVQQHQNQLDDSSPVVRQWHVPDGVCGFAWVTLSPARGKLAAFLKTKGAHKGYYGGYQLSTYDFCPSSVSSQSYERKMAAARAFAKVFQDAGYKMYAEGRLD